MNIFDLQEITEESVCVLDRLLQLYRHEMNEHLKYALVLDENGCYPLKISPESADNYISLIIVNGEYAGFIILNSGTKTPGGLFITDLYILPRYRQWRLFSDIVCWIFLKLDGVIEFCVLQNNKRVLALYDYWTKRMLSRFKKEEEYDDGFAFYRFTFHTADLIADIDKIQREGRG